MFKNLPTILKRRVHPLALLAASLTVVILVTALSGMWHYQYELDHLSKSPSSAAAINRAAKLPSGLQPIDSQSTAPGSAQVGASKGADSKPSTTKQQAPIAAQVSGGGSAASGSSPAASAPITVEVSLGVNGAYKGSLTLSSNSNQCDVLSAALKAGLLSNLDMRYNSQYKTYAVYVINGIGDSNTVWWVYTVNGKNIPTGCGSTPVHTGDSVNWQYLKQ